MKGSRPFGHFHPASYVALHRNKSAIKQGSTQMCPTLNHSSRYIVLFETVYSGNALIRY